MRTTLAGLFLAWLLTGCVQTEAEYKASAWYQRTMQEHERQGLVYRTNGEWKPVRVWQPNNQ